MTIKNVSVTPPTLRLVNKSHYYMVDIKFNGDQQIYYPNAINPSGGYYDFEFTSPGTVDYSVGVGFYDTWYPYAPEVWWYYNGQTTVYDGQTSTVTCNNPTVSELLCNFQSSRKFGGYYWYNLQNYYCYFKFFSTGSWQFYDNSDWDYTGGTLIGEGMVTEVSWPDHSLIVIFRLNDGLSDISINYASGFSWFYHNNGPPGWVNIEYTGQ